MANHPTRKLSTPKEAATHTGRIKGVAAGKPAKAEPHAVSESFQDRAKRVLAAVSSDRMQAVKMLKKAGILTTKGSLKAHLR